MERRNLVIIIASVVLVAVAVGYYYAVFLPGSGKVDLEVPINPIDPEDLTVDECLKLL